MEKIIRKLAKTMNKVANRVGKLEQRVKDKFEKKAPENLKNFMKEPRIIFDNADRLIPKSEIMNFLNTEKEGVHFSKILELIVRLKINNLFEPKKHDMQKNMRVRINKLKDTQHKKKTIRKI